MGEIGKEKTFWLVTAFCFFTIAAAYPFSGMEPPLAAGSFIAYYKGALSSRGMLFLLPVISALPFCLKRKQKQKSRQKRKAPRYQKRQEPACVNQKRFPLYIIRAADANRIRRLYVTVC